MRYMIWAIVLSLFCGVDLAQELSFELPERLLPAGRTGEEVRRTLLSAIERWEIPRGLDAEAARAVWLKGQSARRQAVIERALRPIPAAWETHQVRVEWGETFTRDGYTIRQFLYEPIPTLWIGGLLYEPASYDTPMAVGGKVPVVLNVNGHVGKPGMFIDYKQARCINLVKRGMIAMNVEWIGMGQLSGAGYGHEDMVYLDLAGVPGLSVFYLTMTRALDVLLDLPHADRERVAVTGLSGGGWQTLLISALDDRVTLAAPNAGFIGLRERVMNPQDIGDREQAATDLCLDGDYVHLTALMSPRPLLLIYNAKDECCFAAERAVASVYDPMRELYLKLGIADRVASHVNEDPGTHNYERDNREAFYRFLNQHVVPAAARMDGEIDVTDELFDEKELHLSYPANNATFHSLAREVYAGLPPIPALSKSELEQKRGDLRRLLRLERLEPWSKGRSVMNRERQRAANREVSTGAFQAHGRMSMPWVSMQHRDGQAGEVHIVLDDRGWQAGMKRMRQTPAAQEVVIFTELLFTGESVPPAGSVGQWSMLLETIGFRTLGIHVWQLQALLDRIEEEYPDLPMTIHAQGRVSGLATLVLAALEPERLASLHLETMEASLKDLLERKVAYGTSPSVFCLGLLKCADIATLTRMAAPTTVTLSQEEAQ